jgi:hypothetical protein
MVMNKENRKLILYLALIASLTTFVITNHNIWAIIVLLLLIPSVTGE